jgi:hypothetical protein
MSPSSEVSNAAGGRILIESMDEEKVPFKPTFRPKAFQIKATVSLSIFSIYTANEGPVRIQYKCLVQIYVFPEMKLRDLVISKTEL